MSTIGDGLLPSLTATLVLLVVTAMVVSTSLMPFADRPVRIADLLGDPNLPLLGRVVYLVVGTSVCAIAMATLGSRPGSKPRAIGPLIGVAGWLITTVTFMPLGGAGMFAMAKGAVVPASTLVLQLVFGAVLGSTYGWLRSGGADDRILRT